MQRLRVTIRGAVQGVGFRPFVYRLATEMGLDGWVKNSPQGVFIEAEGQKEALDTFLLRLEREKPGLSFIQSLEYSLLEPLGYEGFHIRHSDASGERATVILPDIATCPQCRRSYSTPVTAASAIPSPTAPSAGRGSASSRPSPTTGRTRP